MLYNVSVQSAPNISSAELQSLLDSQKASDFF